MATNYPYFKFTSSAWLTGDIVFEDLQTQGFFINICAIYWERDGMVTLSEIEKRFARIIDKTEFNRLLANLTDRFISVNDPQSGAFTIKFLDEQLDNVFEVSTRNSRNGAKGGRPKKLKDSDKNPPLSEKNPPLSDLKPLKAIEIREDKIRKEGEREEDGETEIHAPVTTPTASPPPSLADSTLLMLSEIHYKRVIQDYPYLEYLQKNWGKSQTEVLTYIASHHEYVHHNDNKPRTYNDWKSYLTNRYDKHKSNGNKQNPTRSRKVV